MAFVLASLLATPRSAHAGGFYLTDRGTRAGGRGGAFVAGADDPASLYYNPAGLAASGRQLLLDGSLPILRASYQRVDSGGNLLPRVDAAPVPLPIPTAAFTHDFGLRRATFGFGVWAPNAAILEWPETLRVDGGQTRPAPQRYSLLSLRGTLLSTVGVGVGIRVTRHLSVGVTGMLVTGSFVTRTTMSACDGAICTQPEDPDYDVVAQVRAPFFAAPTASIGARLDLGIIRFGASFDLPYRIRGRNAVLEARLPAAPLYGDAYIEGRGSVDPRTGHRRATADLLVNFPWVARVGVEALLGERVRIETAFVVEGWQRQQDITIRMHDVFVRDVIAIGDYAIGDTVIPRHMRNTYSVRGGIEIDLSPLIFRGGLQYETGAFSNQYLTALTLDSSKIIVSLGMSIVIRRHLFLDGMFAVSNMRDVTVTNSRVPQVSAIRPPDMTPAYIGNGRYEMNAYVLSGGLRYTWDSPSSASPAVAPTQRGSEE